MSIHPCTIVVGVDLTEYADTVLEHAFDQALRHDGATLRIVTVIDEPADVEPTRAKLLLSIKQAFEDIVPEARRRDLEVFAHVRTGVTEEEIVDLSEEALATLIVVGRFGAHRRKGSIADSIVAGAGCPVLVVPAPRETSASDAQCPDCVTVRRNSKGEIWFCDRHHADRIGHSIATVNAGSATSRSMW